MALALEIRRATARIRAEQARRNAEALDIKRGTVPPENKALAGPPENKAAKPKKKKKKRK